MLKKSILSTLKRRKTSTEEYGLILSGGVDTSSILEAILELGIQKPSLLVTVCCSPEAKDRDYSILCAEHAKLTGIHHILEISPRELLTSHGVLEQVIKTRETYDGMEIRNTIVPTHALRFAKELNPSITFYLTGDGSDELMGGYSFFWNNSDEEFEERRSKMTRDMTFSTPIMAKEYYQMQTFSPFLEPEFVEYALTLNKQACIGIRDIELSPGDGGQAHITGKIPLREAFPSNPARARRKEPIELGSGSVQMSKEGFYTGENSDMAVSPGLSGSRLVPTRSPEHAYFYKRFCEVFENGVIPSKTTVQDEALVSRCIECTHVLVHKEAMFCRVCGAWPARAMDDSKE